MNTDIRKRTYTLIWLSKNLTPVDMTPKWLSVSNNPVNWFQEICLLINNSSEVASLMLILYLWRSSEHATPIWNPEIRHSVLLSSFELPMKSWAACISLLNRNWSTISVTRPGNVNLAKLWRFKSSLNSWLVGVLPVNISNKRIAKLYTSPQVDVCSPIPYSAKVEKLYWYCCVHYQ